MIKNLKNIIAKDFAKENLLNTFVFIPGLTAQLVIEKKMLCQYSTLPEI
jgi:hypothetical protein